MEWMAGIITGLLVAVLMVLAHNRASGWIFGVGIVYVICVVVRSAIEEAQTQKAGHRAPRWD